MSKEQSRAELREELGRARAEVARLSKLIAAAKIARISRETELKKLSAEWIAANLRASDHRERMRRLKP